MKLSRSIEKIFSVILFLTCFYTVIHLENLDNSARASDLEASYIPITVQQSDIIQQTINLNTFSDDDILCLAKTMYFEARGQQSDGIEAVGDVVMNRYKDSRYPKTLCDIVYQKRGHTCQFSWHCDGREFNPDTIDPHSKRREIWEYMKVLAKTITVTYNGEQYVDKSCGAVNFHAYYVHPHWSHDFTKTIRIGAHIFFKRAGVSES